MARSATVEPLEKYRFLIEWGGQDRAGFHDCQMPKKVTAKVAYRQGDDQDTMTTSAGIVTMEDIILTRGLLLGSNYEESTEDFLNWVGQVHNPTKNPGGEIRGIGPQGSKLYRKDITIKMLSRTGSVARKWILYNAFPVNYTPGSDLHAQEDGEKSMESMTLAYEDFVELSINEEGQLVQKIKLLE